MDVEHKTIPHEPKPALLGITPLLVFLGVYLLSSILLGDFYAMPLSLGFLVASIYAVMITRGLSVEERLRQFSRGASDSNIMLMVWIFILAGAFASGASSIGAVDATVQLILYILPPGLLLPGLFIASCLVSLSIGTSVGTIVALTPIALGFSESLGLEPAYIAAVVTGGAFFGDNLSFISDTTIAATRTQGVKMKDKFWANIRIVLPAAIITLIIYSVAGASLEPTNTEGSLSFWLLLPYLIVMITALAGVNVLAVLVIGIVVCGIVGVSTGQVDFWTWIGTQGKGINSMGELIIVTLLAGGMLELIRYNGGIAYLLQLLTRRVRGRRGGELAIAALVVLANTCTANNTIAILTTGSMAWEISQRYGIDPRRSASLLDTFSCVAQGLIPYGAQLLLAAGFAKISPVSLIPYLYYPMVVGVVTLINILVGHRR